MALREVLARFGITVDGVAKLKEVTGTADKSTASLQGLGKAFAGAAAAIGLFKVGRMIADTANAADSAVDLADALGVATEEWQALQAFGATAGGTDMVVGLRTLAKAAENNDKAFAKLGVSTRGANGQIKPMARLAEESLVALSDLDDATSRVALSAILFGRSGNTLIPSLRNGSEAMREQLKRARELGVAFDADLGASAGDFNDTLYYINAQMMRFRGSILKFLLPTMNAISERLLAGQQTLNGWAKAATGSSATMNALGATAGVAVSALAVSKWAQIAGALGGVNRVAGLLTKRFLVLAAVFLVVQDFFTFLRGGESVIGKILAEFGLIDNATESGKRFGETLESWAPAFREALGAVKKFGTETLVTFGALFGMLTEKNADTASEFESVFLRNGQAIDRFGGVWFSVFGAAHSVLATVWSALASFAGFIADKFLAMHQYVIGVIGSLLSFIVAQVTASLAGLWSIFDSVFGTDIAGSIRGAGAVLQSVIGGAVDFAIGKLEDLRAAAASVIRDVQAILSDPIGSVASKLTGQGWDGQASAREAAAFARRQQGGGAVTVAPSTTINVTAPAGDAPAVARATAGAVAQVNARNLTATLAAVDR